MFRKSELPPGWPDFTFAYLSVSVLWECKSLTGELRDSQERVVGQLIRNGWRFRLIRSSSKPGSTLERSTRRRLLERRRQDE